MRAPSLLFSSLGLPTVSFLRITADKAEGMDYRTDLYPLGSLHKSLDIITVDGTMHINSTGSQTNFSLIGE